MLLAGVVVVYAVVAATGVAGGFTEHTPKPPSTYTRPAPAGSPTATTGLARGIPASCHIRDGALPDPHCTPGAINPDVTQDNLAATICHPGFSRKIRPPVSVTNKIKRQVMITYGIKDDPKNYELDHLIPLSWGGAPADITNLWPEPGASPNQKDKLELAGFHALCTHQISLADAQTGIANNWQVLAAQLHITP